MDMVGGWQNTPEKYEFVNWDDDIPNWMGKWKMFQPTNQNSMKIIYAGISSSPLDINSVSKITTYETPSFQLLLEPTSDAGQTGQKQKGNASRKPGSISWFWGSSADFRFESKSPKTIWNTTDLPCTLW